MFLTVEIISIHLLCTGHQGKFLPLKKLFYFSVHYCTEICVNTVNFVINVITCKAVFVDNN